MTPAKKASNKRYYQTHAKYYAAYRRTYYRKNKQHILAVNRANRNARYEMMRRAKDKPCADCGHRFHHSAMDFDHVRGKKHGCVARLNVSMEKMLREIAKCEVVCSNCHRIRTWQRRHHVSATQ